MYIEHNLGKEGGRAHVEGASLPFPPEETCNARRPREGEGGREGEGKLEADWDLRQTRRDAAPHVPKTLPGELQICQKKAER